VSTSIYDAITNTARSSLLDVLLHCFPIPSRIEILLFDLAMFKNFDTCPHCKAKGKPTKLRRLRVDTPVISRSDGSQFHLALFDGPNPFYPNSSSLRTGILMGDFRYVHDQRGGAVAPSTVIFTNRGTNEAATLRQLERAADQLARILVKHNFGLCRQYNFDGTKLKSTGAPNSVRH